MNVPTITVVVLVLLVLIAWAGLRVRPAPLPPFGAPAGTAETVPLRQSLPAPVARFYELLYGNAVPEHTSAVLTGRGRITLRGVTFPARFRFTHDAGRAYRHYIELTWFGLPVMRVNERYVDGRARLELPFGITEDEPKVDQAANLALWAESMWLPSVFITDPRARWEALDDQSSVLVVPWTDAEERLVVRFDEATLLPRFALSMRYREADSARKSLWINEVREWGDVDGHRVPTVAAVTWYEDGAPWAVLHVESVVCGADVSDYVRSRGP